MQRLQEKYNKEILPALQAELGIKNPNAVPKIKQIVVNVGVGKLFREAKQLETIASDLSQLTGQKPVQLLSKKSIAGFKVREGTVSGLKVTLRGERMYSFLDKLINVTLPRVRDFRGVPSKAFDGRGNYHLGMKEQIVFPEVPPESVTQVFGLQVSILTTAGTDDLARALLKKFGFPFTS